jgi:hypothetical protein
MEALSFSVKGMRMILNRQIQIQSVSALSHFLLLNFIFIPATQSIFMSHFLLIGKVSLKKILF